MKALIQNRWVLLGLRLLIGGVFVYSGWLKLLNPQAFADSIATFRLLPGELINILALALPPFELIVGALLIIGWQKRAATFSVLVLTGIFVLALGQALARGLEVDCGCFGSGAPSTLKTWTALGRDLLLIGAAVVLYRSSLLEMQKGSVGAVEECNASRL